MTIAMLLAIGALAAANRNLDQRLADVAASLTVSTAQEISCESCTGAGQAWCLGTSTCGGTCDSGISVTIPEQCTCASTDYPSWDYQTEGWLDWVGFSVSDPEVEVSTSFNDNVRVRQRSGF